MSTIPTHPRWCEPDLCVPLEYDDPDGPRLHQGATVVYGDHAGGELIVSLSQAGDEPPVVAIGGATIPLSQASLLSGTLLRLVDLSLS